MKPDVGKWYWFEYAHEVEKAMCVAVSHEKGLAVMKFLGYRAIMFERIVGEVDWSILPKRKQWWKFW